MRPHFLVAATVSLVLLALIVVGAVIGARWHRRHPHALAMKAEALWTQLGRRWSTHAYLSMHLIVGLCVSVLALWAFAALADDVAEREWITQFDVALDDSLHAHSTRAGIRVARLLSDVGSPIAMTLLMIVVAIVLWVRRERILLATWLAAFVGGSVLDQALKFFFRRPRPTFDTPIITARGFSFPSGHAMGSLIGFGLVAYLLTRAARSSALRASIVAAAVVLVAAIGVSRLYLGVHFFSDVIAGYAAGIVWLSVCLSGAEIATAQRSQGLV